MRPDTRPIEDPAERPKILLAKLGASTHAGFAGGSNS
ncbi:methylmalonyl-CoA mutase cobalamin-binding subunit [Labrenzia sp. EL_208]|nr:methylmalonyl-CoA mutase cobalamin-binding subunit [Labrenzia sp. EL_132]MBG6233431.1 methylmalonyl-CoA mutase cobalamin-binding subunit [Labrenzia sp. EL_208]